MMMSRLTAVSFGLLVLLVALTMQLSTGTYKDGHKEAYVCRVSVGHFPDKETAILVAQYLSDRWGSKFRSILVEGAGDFGATIIFVAPKAEPGATCERISLDHPAEV